MNNKEVANYSRSRIKYFLIKAQLLLLSERTLNEGDKLRNKVT